MAEPEESTESTPAVTPATVSACAGTVQQTRAASKAGRARRRQLAKAPYSLREQSLLSPPMENVSERSLREAAR